MRIDLDDAKLAENEVWLQKNFDRQIERIKMMLTHFAEVDLPQALRFIDYDRERTTGPTTHSDAAANIVSMLTQAVSNCDLRGLVNTAGDLSQNKTARGALQALKDSLPPEVAGVLNTQESVGALERAAAKQARQDALDKAKAEQCQERVPEGGRSVSFRQCGRKGTKIGDDGKRYCFEHIKKHKAA